MSSGEYDASKVRSRLEARQENEGRSDHGEATLSDQADDSPHNGSSPGELRKYHHADDPDVPFCASGIANPCRCPAMAILYPRGGTPDWSNTYGRLEGAAFQLKTFRPHLRIIDRSHMQDIVSEQRFQAGGLVSEDSAVRIGQILGVDSVLIYRIEGPTLRERFFARRHRDLPPMTITSKIIRVESGEIVYHNVVTTHVGDAEESGWSLSDNVDCHRWSHEALDRGIMQTVYDLHRAFD